MNNSISNRVSKVKVSKYLKDNNILILYFNQYKSGDYYVSKLEVSEKSKKTKLEYTTDFKPKLEQLLVEIFENKQ